MAYEYKPGAEAFGMAVARDKKEREERIMKEENIKKIQEISEYFKTHKVLDGVLEDGNYSVILDSISLGKSKNGNDNIEFVFVISYGPYIGRKITYSTVIAWGGEHRIKDILCNAGMGVNREKIPAFNKDNPQEYSDYMAKIVKYSHEWGMEYEIKKYKNSKGYMEIEMVDGYQVATPA